MSVIFLQEKYDPFPDPNSICLSNLIIDYKKSNNDYYIVCDGPIGYEKKFSNDPRIIHVPYKRDIVFSKKNNIQKVKTIFQRLLSLPKWPIRFSKKVKKYIKAIKPLLVDGQKHIIISVYKPAEMIEVGFFIKKHYPSVVWYIYSLDGIGKNFLTFDNPLLIEREKAWLYKRFSKSDKIFQMICHKTEFEKSIYKVFLNKTIFLDFPMIVNNRTTLTTKRKETNQIVFLYAGSFYKGLREPFVLLDFFKHILDYIDSELLLFTQNDFVDCLENAANDSNGRIKRFNYVCPEKMEEIMSNSDILVSIGNLESNMVPSKIFNYMSSGKKILHFASGESDSSLPYLLKYRNAFIVFEKKDFNMDLFKTFLSDNSIVPFSELAKLFPMNIPKNTLSHLFGDLNYDNC